MDNRSEENNLEAMSRRVEELYDSADNLSGDDKRRALAEIQQLKVSMNQIKMKEPEYYQSVYSSVKSGLDFQKYMTDADRRNLERRKDQFGMLQVVAELGMYAISFLLTSISLLMIMEKGDGFFGYYGLGMGDGARLIVAGILLIIAGMLSDNKTKSGPGYSFIIPLVIWALLMCFFRIEVILPIKFIKDFVITIMVYGLACVFLFEIGMVTGKDLFGGVKSFMKGFDYSDGDFKRKYIKIAMARKGFN